MPLGFCRTYQSLPGWGIVYRRNSQKSSERIEPHSTRPPLFRTAGRVGEQALYQEFYPGESGKREPPFEKHALSGLSAGAFRPEEYHSSRFRQLKNRTSKQNISGDKILGTLVLLFRMQCGVRFGLLKNDRYNMKNIAILHRKKGLTKAE